MTSAATGKLLAYGALEFAATLNQHDSSHNLTRRLSRLSHQVHRLRPQGPREHQDRRSWERDRGGEGVECAVLCTKMMYCSLCVAQIVLNQSVKKLHAIATN